MRSAQPLPADAPADISDGNRLLRNSPTDSREVTIDENEHRRLSYTFVAGPHTTTLATITGMINPPTTPMLLQLDRSVFCSSVAGTYFWKDSSWQCYEPDHDANAEYAYGECFGRCGGVCGSNGSGTYTYEYLDHDSWVRFGHFLASFWRNDEFISTIDDAAFAPNCISLLEAQKCIQSRYTKLYSKR